jgi:hypothetical protein
MLNFFSHFNQALGFSLSHNRKAGSSCSSFFTLFMGLKPHLLRWIIKQMLEHLFPPLGESSHLKVRERGR